MIKFKKTAKLKWNTKRSFDASDDNLAHVDSNDTNNLSFSLKAKDTLYTELLEFLSLVKFALLNTQFQRDLNYLY